MIPANVTAAITSLNFAIGLASPLDGKTPTALASAITFAHALNLALDAAIPGAAGALDGPDPKGDGPTIIAAFLALSASANDQANMQAMRGYSGRIELNLKQSLG